LKQRLIVATPDANLLKKGQHHSSFCDADLKDKEFYFLIKEFLCADSKGDAGHH
jgi:hypothetical protein